MTVLTAVPVANLGRDPGTDFCLSYRVLRMTGSNYDLRLFCALRSQELELARTNAPFVLTAQHNANTCRAFWSMFFVLAMRKEVTLVLRSAQWNLRLLSATCFYFVLDHV